MGHSESQFRGSQDRCREPLGAPGPNRPESAGPSAPGRGRAARTRDPEPPGLTRPYGAADSDGVADPPGLAEGDGRPP